MDRVVTKPLKIDFHIHSECSKYKDEYNLVKDGTVKNISLLIEKINSNNINMCAITDHDYFSYKLYSSLKSFEGTESLLKVFPGVEFSVGFKGDNDEIKPVHVICIFDDTNENQIKEIGEKIPFKNDKVDYGNNQKYFSEEKFISILKDINLNVITIAHQKNSITSKDAYKSKNDASSLGAVKFNELIACEYFESFEFKNMKNGLFNNVYAIDKNKNYDQVRFITGSDCHDWNCYPKHDISEDDNIGFQYTYLKCLPCFRGLAMSFSDMSRISTNDHLFNQKSRFLDKISMSIRGEKIDIPLSKGINVIIGDNSIGKSLLLHKLTNYENLTGTMSSIRSGYDLYLEKNKVEIYSIIKSELIHTFDY